MIFSARENCGELAPDFEGYAHPPNAITLSCKAALHACLRAARRLPRRTRSGRSEVAADVPPRAVGAAQGGSAAEPTLGGFCQL